MQFLLFPPPLDDEWIGSWLVRLAEANLLSLKKVLSLLGISSPDLVPDLGALQRLAAATYLTPEQIVPMVLLPEQTLNTIGSSRTSGSRPFLGVQFLQLCSGCLATDPVPYVRKTWLLATSVTCDLHGGPLLDRCPHCQRHLQVFRKHRLKLQETQLLVLHHSPSDLRQCPVCRGSLTSASTRLKQLPPEQPAPGQFTTPANWTRFVATLDWMIIAFGLTDLIDVSREQPWSPASRPTPGPLLVNSLNMAPVERRFQATLLRRQLLIPVPGEPPLSALKRFAADLLEQTQRSPERNRRRWQFLGWLAYALKEGAPEDLLTCWPGLAAFVDWRRLNRDLPHSGSWISEFRLTDAQWALADPDLTEAPEDPGHLGVYRDRREAFEAYLHLLLTDQAWSSVPKAYAGGRVSMWRLEAWILSWEERKCMNAPLERLYHHLLTHIENRSSRWVLETEALFLSDRIIDLLIRERLPSALDILLRLRPSMQEESVKGK